MQLITHHNSQGTELYFRIPTDIGRCVLVSVGSFNRYLSVVKYVLLMKINLNIIKISEEI